MTYRIAAWFVLLGIAGCPSTSKDTAETADFGEGEGEGEETDTSISGSDGDVGFWFNTTISNTNEIVTLYAIFSDGSEVPLGSFSLADMPYLPVFVSLSAGDYGLTCYSNVHGESHTGLTVSEGDETTCICAPASDPAFACYPGKLG